MPHQGLPSYVGAVCCEEQATKGHKGFSLINVGSRTMICVGAVQGRFSSPLILHIGYNRVLAVGVVVDPTTGSAVSLVGFRQE